MEATALIAEAGKSQNWSGLHPGQQVAVQEPVGEPYPAIVDALTDDHSVVWIVAERGYQRKAFDYREGVILTPA